MLGGQAENVAGENPVIGAIKAIAADPTNANVVYVGSVNGGIWKTVNATDTNPTWRPLTDTLSAMSIGDLQFDPTDPTHQTLIAGVGRYSSYGRFGGPLSGVMITTDGGAHWVERAVPGIVPPGRAMNIAGVAIRGSTIVVSADGGESNFINDRGIYRSTDGGITFTNISNRGGTGLPLGVAFCLAGDPTNPNVLYAGITESNRFGGSNGIYRSLNQGATWTKVSNSTIDALIHDATSPTSTENMKIAVGQSGQVFVGIINRALLPSGNIGDQLAGLFRSSDGQTNWQQLDLPATIENGVSQGLEPEEEEEIGEEEEDGGDEEEVGQSTDSPPPGGQGAIHFSIAADPTNPNIVYVGGDSQPGPFPNSLGAEDFSGRLFRGDASKPSGSQWANLTHKAIAAFPGGGTAHNSAPHADSRAMAFDANGDLLEGDDGGIFRRTSPRSSGGDWVSVNGTLQVTELHDIAYDSNSGVILGGAQDDGTPVQSAPGSSTWFEVTTGDGGDVAIDNTTLAAQGRSLQYSSFQNLGAFRYFIVDANNNPVGLVLPKLQVTGGGAPLEPQFKTPIALNAISPTRLVIVAENSIYESADQGETLTDIGEAVEENATFDQDAVVYGGIRNGVANADVLYVGRNDGVFVRTTAGGTLAETAAAFPGTSDVRDIALDANDWMTAYVIDENQVFRTTDAGASWTNLTGNLVTLAGVADFYTNVFVPGASPFLLVGGLGGVYQMMLSAPGVWTRYGTGLPNTVTRDLVYNAKADVLVAATMGRGAWLVQNVTQNLANQPPTLDAITDPAAILEDAGLQTINLTGISPGPASEAGQTVTITATSSNTALIPNPTVNYTNPNAIGSLTYTPAANASGTTVITVTITDSGGTANGGLNTTTRSFAVTVTAVNDAPVNAVPAPQATNEDTNLVFSSTNGNLISVSDVDAASGTVKVTLSVTSGVLTLGSLAGLGFVTGDGTADPTVAFTGTLASVNAALAGLTYFPTANFNGSATLTITTDDQSNTGTGGAKTDSDTVTITVNAVNDAPVNSVPGAQTTAEDTVAVFSTANGNLISIGDVDAAGSDVKVTLSVTNGVLTLSSTAGLSFTTGDGTADVSMVFTGTIASVNAAMAGLSYIPPQDFNGSATISITTDDQGNTGTGGSRTDADTVAITVSAVNDAPVNSVPGAQSAAEDTSLVFSSANGNLISVSDVDAGGNALKVTLSVTNGVLTLSGTAGLSITTGDGTADASMVFTGTLASVNAALAGLMYLPTAEFSGPAALSITTDDQGNTGGGGAQTDTDTIAITVNAVNDAPINSVPGVQSTSEDASLVFASANSNLIRVSDVDVGAGAVTVTLTVTNGLLTLSGIAGLVFSTGDGTADASMVFSGTIDSVDVALAGLTYIPTQDFNGSATLSITSDDQGNTGAGGSRTDTDTVAITVNAVNDAPINNVPGAQSTNENSSLVFSSANGNLVSVSDVDAGAAAVKVTLTATNGVVTLSGIAGLSLTSGDGTADPSMVFTGRLADVNAALAGLTFIPAQDFNGPAALSITTDDQGNTGTGGAQTDTDTVSITVGSTNDPPVNSVPGAQSTSEDVNLVFSTANGNLVSVSDPDAGANEVKVTLSVTNGTLTLSGTAGLSFTTGDGTADASMVFTGTIASVNAALASLSFSPTADFSGLATLTITTDDQGNTGGGGARTDTDTVAITVNAVNDAPVNSVPGPQATAEDSSLAFSLANGNLLSISDGDVASSEVKVTLSVTNGVLTLGGTTGLAFSIGDGTADASMTFTGTIASVNAALAGLTYVPTADFNGSATLTIITDDQGNTGSGGARTDTDTVAITVNAVNDAPVNQVPAAQATLQDTPLVFSSANGNAISVTDIDAGAGPVQVSLVASNGVLTLSGTTGLGFTTGDGTADSSMVFTGTLASVNAALAGLTFSPNAGFSGSAGLSITTDDQANTGSGGAKSDSDSVAITVTLVNSAPVNNVPGPQSTSEDTSLVFSTANGNLISVSDGDAGAAAVKVTLAVTNGLLTLGGIAGLSITTGDGTADASMVFTGTIASVNAALAGLTYLPAAEFSGAATLTITTDDQGNTGTGGAKADTDTVTITVNAVNDAPVNNVPGPQATSEDTNVVFTSASGNPISVSDTDAGGSSIKVTLSVTNGVLTLGGTAGLNFGTGDGNADATMVFTGSIASVNAALAGLTYIPAQDFNGPTTLTIITDDQGNTGTGGAKTDTDTVAITVSAVNDAPVNSVPGVQSTSEDVSLTFSSANGNLISVSDVDAGNGAVKVTVSVTSGVLTLGSLAGLNITTGDGTADPTIVFTGTLASVNGALAGLVYTPTQDFSGPATLTITTDDQGNTGAGSPKTDTDTVAITVSAVNDAPVNSVPGPQTTSEESSLVFSSGNGNPIGVTDIDAGTSDVKVTLSVTNGVLTLSGIAGLRFTTGDGTGDASMVFTGSIASVNAALAGLTYLPTANFNGPATLTITTDDQGNTGSGGAKTDTDTVAITVSAVNDAPVNSVPGPQSSAEDAALVFSSATGNLISVSDIDAADSAVKVTLSVTSGVVTLSGTVGLGFTTGDGTADASMVFTGTLASVNAALAGLTYLPTQDYNGPDTLTVTIDDQGNTGIGGAKTDTDTVAITVSAVNDAPVNLVPNAQSTSEDGSLVFSSANGNLITISDVDAGTGDVKVTLSVTNGVLTLGGIAGLSFTTGDGTADGSMVFTGGIASVNAALASLTYTTIADFNGPATLSITTDDLGNAGSGGPRTDIDTVPIMVDAVNDAPVNHVPAGQTTPQNVSLVFSPANGNAISVTDIDAGAGPVQVSLVASNGVLTLSGTAGLGFTTGDGTADSSMVFTGTLADVNAALAGLTFSPNAGFSGPAGLTITTDDQGNTGSGGAKSDSDSVPITVTLINGPPVNSVPGPQSTSEDTSLVFSTANGNLVSVSDPDAGANAVQVTLAVTNGVLTLSGIAGLGFTTGDGTADGSMVFTGGIASVNAALAGLTYIPTSNFNGPATLTVTTDDQGNTGTGGAKSDTDTVTITVNAVNDAPVNSVPGTQTTSEDTSVVFSSANGNPISVSDVDAAGGEVKVTLAVTNGVLTLGGLTGLTFSTGDGTADATMTFTGSLTDVNAALAGLTYFPTADFNGSDTLTITTDDQANTGAGGAKTDSDSVAITVSAVNDAPVNSVPGAQSTSEDTSLVFSSANGNLISVGDVDAGGAEVKVTLSVTSGFLTLGGTAGLSFTTGDGTADSTMVFTGTIGSVNASLASLTYIPIADFNGPATLSITTDDLGNAGSGGPKTDTDTVAITVNAVNDAPINSVPGAQTTAEDTSVVFSPANGNPISVNDVDAGGNALKVTLSVTNGVLTLSGIAGLVFTTGDGTADASMVFTGTLASVNAALAGLGYVPTADFNGPATLTITTDDQGNTGSGGAMTDADTVAITVSAVNDAPVNSVPGAQSTSEDASLVFSSTNSNLISVSDVDAGASAVAVTLTVTNGLLTLSGIGGLNFSTGDGTADASMVFTGSIASVNAALAGLIFSPTADFNGPATLTITTDDQGSTGAGGARTDADTVAIDVVAVNDAPVNSVPGPQSTTEDTSVVFSLANGNLLSVSDIDAAGGAVKLTLTVTNGVLSLGATAGLSFTTGDGTADSNMVFTGSIASVNAALAGLTYTPAADFNGPATLTVTTDDQGNTGSGGARADTDTVAITVTSVNDPPVNSVPAAQSTSEDTSLVFSSAKGNLISVADVDAAGGNVTVTLAVTNGVLTLGGTAGLSFGTGDGTADATMVFTGTLGSVNAALAGLTYIPTADFNGPATLTITSDDQGNTGDGGARADTDTVAITVSAVNDPPVSNVPGGQTTNEDTSLTFSAGQGNAITVSDIDAGNEVVRLTVAVEHGVVTLSSLSNVVTIGGANGSGSITVAGTLTSLDAALEGLVYAPAANFGGTDTLTVTIDDQGHSGSGGPKTASSSVFIVVVAVADAPTLSVNAAPGVEGVPTPLNVATALTDTDGSESLTIRISGVPAGVTLSHGTNLGGGVWRLTSADLPGLTILSPDSQSFTLDVDATTTEASNASTATTTRSVNVEFSNAPPTALVSGRTHLVRGQALNLALSATDAPADAAAGFTYRINWNDGSPIETVLPGGPASVAHAFVASRTYVVQVTATDKDGGVSAPVNHRVVVDAVALEPSASDPTKTILAVGGTTGADTILLVPGGAPGSVQVFIGGALTMTARPTGGTLVYGQAGNDTIVSAVRSAVLMGGLGDDTLIATLDDGRNMLVGGPGKDALSLFGSGQLMLGGSSLHDDNDAALTALLDEWSGGGTYAARVGHLMRGGGRNGSFLLNDQTVFDDLAANTLRVFGRDLFVFMGGADQGNPTAATTLVKVRRKP